MRRARLKPKDIPVFQHLYNRVAGEPGYFPFHDPEKEAFTRLLHDLDRYYTVKLVDHQVMSNHFHLVAYVPDKPPNAVEVCRRYNAYYKGKRPPLDPSDPQCREIGEQMRDISWYMRALQQQFTTWFNRTRPGGRRGTLWAGRFKNTVLGDARAVWECLKYIEMNPVRAGMVANPADYRFCGMGAWAGTGEHPFAQNVREVLLPWLASYNGIGSMQGLRKALEETFGEVTGSLYEEQNDMTRFQVGLNRRVRYWVDGLVIGSELFIKEMTSRYQGILRTKPRGPTRARGPDDAPLPLYCYKRLRTV